MLSIYDLSAEEIICILDTAEKFKEVSERRVKKVPALRGMTVVNFFVEPSTRTRVSFELAEQRLSADVVNMQAQASSLLKGETLLDTVKNIEALQVDLVVMRHSAPGAQNFIAKHLKCGVVNAGDGAHEHPTQALLVCVLVSLPSQPTNRPCLLRNSSVCVWCTHASVYVCVHMSGYIHVFMYVVNACVCMC